MTNGSGSSRLARGYAIAFLAASGLLGLAAYGGPTLARKLTMSGATPGSIPTGAAMVIDFGNVVRYYWPFAMPFLALLLLAALYYALLAKRQEQAA